MSQNQSRAERSGSAQYRKTGRSGSSNQPRQYPGGVPTKGGGGASSAPPNASNRSFKKNNNNSSVPQTGTGAWNVDSSDSPAVHGAQNGAHQQQPTQRVPEASASKTSSNLKPTDASTLKTTRPVPKSPSSYISSAAASSNPTSASSESKAPATPGKASGDASKSFPLQFGSISPGFMNGMQIPARTSSAPPNLDEQKKDQARYEPSGTAALPAPSVPKQHFPKKDAGIHDQLNSVETHIASKPKRDAQVSIAPSGIQSQKPTPHPMPGMAMQLPFHQQQMPIQFSGPNPQIQSQALSGTSLPMPNPMSLPLGNPPVQHKMFVPGLQPHPMQSQGMMHQGQGLNFSPQMGPQLSPQLGNMGMSLAQFPQQTPINYSGSRKTVKITHPETHEELRLDTSPAPRLHPSVQSQTHPISSFPPNMPINYYTNSYNAAPLFYPPASSVPLSNTQVPPTSQPPRLYSQVTVKSPIVSHAEKDSLPPSGALPLGKPDASRPSRLKGEHPASSNKEIEPSSKAGVGASFVSVTSQPKAGVGASFVSATSSSPVTVERGAPYLASGSAAMDGPVSVSTSSSHGARTGTVHDSFKDNPKRPGSRGRREQDLSQSTSVSSLPLQLPEVATLEEKHITSETAKDPLLTSVAASCEASSMTTDGATEEKSDNTFKGLEKHDSTLSEPEVIGGLDQEEATLAEQSLETPMMSLSLESPDTIGKIKESSNQEVASTNGESSEHTQEKPEEFSSHCSNDAKREGNLAVPAGISGGQKLESSVSVIALPDQHETISTSNALCNSPKSIDMGEQLVANGTTKDQDSASISDSSPPEGVVGSANEDTVSSTVDLVSPTPSSVKEKVSDANAVKGVAPKNKKKKKELYRKAEAAGTSSDLYMAYKGPEEKKETVTTVEGLENSSSQSGKKTSIDVSQEDAVVCENTAPSKVEPEDWEDAAEISSPQLGDLRHETKDNDDADGSTTKKYSRDFLLKFVEQCSNLPEGFNISSDIADSLMAVSSMNVPRESYPSPGRNVDRHAGGPRPDRRGSGLGDDEKWNKFPGPLMAGRGEMWPDVSYMNNVVGFRPGQGGNYGVLRNPRAQTPQYAAGGILSGPMQSLGPQGGQQRNNVDSDRWLRGTGFQKGLMPYPQAPIMHKAEKKYEVGKVSDEEEAKQRQLKAILNKLTPQNFDKLFQQVKDVNIDNVITLSGVISQIFDKALMEPTFCEMYADFCFHLAADLPDLSVDNEKITFKRLLLNKCQEEFERGEREEEEANKVEEEGEVKQSAEVREEKRLSARRRMLGNIRLIGELYKKRMLTERIMHECINKLLGQYQNPDEENIEALCKLMSTIGVMIDHPKAKEHMDYYYDIMAQLSNNMKLSSRVRFMLKDAIDLRKNKWQQRRKVEGPKKIEEVHRDAAQERAQVSRLGRAPSMSNSARRGPPMDFGPRSPSMLPSPNSQISGFRGAPPQLRGYGSQDARTDERHSSVPLPQRLLGDDSITLGPQGGLARGMAFRGQPLPANVTLNAMQSSGDGRRIGPGQNGYSSIPDRPAYGQREDLMPRYMPDRFAAPTYDQSHPQERTIIYGNRDVRNDRASDGSLPSSHSPRGGPPSVTHDVPSDKVCSEEHLHDKSIAAIKEFYSARDEKEVALCIKDLNTPSFYPSMISIWVTDSFERKDTDRDVLTKLLINLTKPQDRMISEDQLIKGFESVLAVLEDAVNDAPRAGEFLGRIFGKIIAENIVPLSVIGRLIHEGGEVQGQLVQMGIAADVLGSIFETIEAEKGESVLNEMRSSSKLRVEEFRPAGGGKKTSRIDKYI